MNRPMTAKELIEKYNYIETQLNDCDMERANIKKEIDKTNENLTSANHTLNSLKKCGFPMAIVLGLSLIGIGVLSAIGEALAVLLMLIPALGSFSVLLTMFGYEAKVKDLFHSIANLKIERDKSESKLKEVKTEKQILLDEIKAYRLRSESQTKNIKPQISNNNNLNNEDEIQL